MNMRIKIENKNFERDRKFKKSGRSKGIMADKFKQKIKTELGKALEEKEEISNTKWNECDNKKIMKRWHKVNERIRILRRLLNDDLSKKGEELKTLKDMFDGYWFVPALRQEAIKRIKSCKAPVNFTRSDRCGTKGEYCELCKRDMWFYNLTEEDLA